MKIKCTDHMNKSCSDRGTQFGGTQLEKLWGSNVTHYMSLSNTVVVILVLTALRRFASLTMEKNPTLRLWTRSV